MDLTPVESSHIASIGYLEADQVLLVRYRDGGLYARPGWSPEQFRDLCAASSKGAFLRSTAGPSILITKGGRAEDSSQSNERAVAATPSGPLNVLDEMANPCCWSTFVALTLSTRLLWDCPNCGLHFEAQMVGPVRHWRVKAAFAIARPAR